MKQLILILILFVFAFSSCSKSDDNQTKDTGSKKPDTSDKLSNDNGSKKSDIEDDEFPEAIPINKVEDSLNPFKILGEVKSAKLVYHRFAPDEDFSIELDNPSKWPKLLFAEYEDVVWDCKYECDIIFETSTGTHNVHLEPIQCELGEYEEGKTRLRYNFSPEFYTALYEVLKSKTKPDQPHHKDNHIAAFLITRFCGSKSSEGKDAVQLLKEYINGNEEIDDELKESLNSYIRSYTED